MNLRIITVLMVIAVTSIFSASGTPGQQKTFKDQIAGAWTLVSNETIAVDGSKQQNFGGNPKGVLILDVSGSYASVSGHPDRPKFKAGNNRSKATPEEWAAAAQAFAANSGTWSVNEADKTLIRKFEIALIPNNDANETKASIHLGQNELS